MQSIVSEGRKRDLKYMPTFSFFFIIIQKQSERYRVTEDNWRKLSDHPCIFNKIDP